MCALEGERSPAVAWIEAVAGMAAAVRHGGPDDVAREVFRFRQAGLSIDQLQVLAESLTRSPEEPFVIRL